ncbi:hypothetical protein MTO96_008778 [Rhipicephalus appendiculatus]
MQATLEELFANLTLQRGSSEREQRRCVEEEGNAPAPSGFQASFRSPRPERIAEQARPKFSKAEPFSPTKQKVTWSKSRGGAISETDAASILKQIREILQENGPTQEDDLLEALGSSQTRVIIQAHGTLTAFLDRRPGFRVVREELYTFIYYQDPEEEDEAAGRSSSVKVGGATASCQESSVECTGRRLQAAAGDAGHRRMRSNSSSSDSYESAVEGEEEERERRRYPLRNGFARMPSRPRHSRAGRAIKQMRDAEVQTQVWYPNPIAELEYTLQKRKAEITELQEALKALQLSQARELQQLRTSISKLLKRPPPTPPWSVTGGNEYSHRRVRNEANCRSRGKRAGQSRAPAMGIASAVSTAPSEAREAAHAGLRPEVQPTALRR